MLKTARRFTIASTATADATARLLNGPQSRKRRETAIDMRLTVNLVTATSEALPLSAPVMRLMVSVKGKAGCNITAN